ncbi:hypothetical protein GQ42DRAFT_161626 [Ramicandelaber brevisporus]|nr:hypothetical protein GQ42DRAFT_161626 [Ramicandelaber brevisporus]
MVANGAIGASPDGRYIVEALYDFGSANPGDLAFAKGDLIETTDCSNPQWWKGSLMNHGKVGQFPSAFVRIMYQLAAPAIIEPVDSAVAITSVPTMSSTSIQATAATTAATTTTVMHQPTPVGITRPASQFLNSGGKVTGNGSAHSLALGASHLHSMIYGNDIPIPSSSATAATAVAVTESKVALNRPTSSYTLTSSGSHHDLRNTRLQQQQYSTSAFTPAVNPLATAPPVTTTAITASQTSLYSTPYGSSANVAVQAGAASHGLAAAASALSPTQSVFASALPTSVAHLPQRPSNRAEIAAGSSPAVPNASSPAANHITPTGSRVHLPRAQQQQLLIKQEQEKKDAELSDLESALLCLADTEIEVMNHNAQVTERNKMIHAASGARVKVMYQDIDDNINHNDMVRSPPPPPPLPPQPAKTKSQVSEQPQHTPQPEKERHSANETTQPPPLPPPPVPEPPAATASSSEEQIAMPLPPPIPPPPVISEQYTQSQPPQPSQPQPQLQQPQQPLYQQQQQQVQYTQHVTAPVMPPPVVQYQQPYIYPGYQQPVYYQPQPSMYLPQQSMYIPAAAPQPDYYGQFQQNPHMQSAIMQPSVLDLRPQQSMINNGAPPAIYPTMPSIQHQQQSLQPTQFSQIYSGSRPHSPAHNRQSPQPTATSTSIATTAATTVNVTTAVAPSATAATVQRIASPATASGTPSNRPLPVPPPVSQSQLSQTRATPVTAANQPVTTPTTASFQPALQHQLRDEPQKESKDARRPLRVSELPDNVIANVHAPGGEQFGSTMIGGENVIESTPSKQPVNMVSTIEEEEDVDEAIGIDASIVDTANAINALNDGMSALALKKDTTTAATAAVDQVLAQSSGNDSSSSTPQQPPVTASPESTRMYSSGFEARAAASLAMMVNEPPPSSLQSTPTATGRRQQSSALSRPLSEISTPDVAARASTTTAVATPVLPWISSSSGPSIVSDRPLSVATTTSSPTATSHSPAPVRFLSAAPSASVSSIAGVTPPAPGQAGQYVDGPVLAPGQSATRFIRQLAPVVDSYLGAPRRRIQPREQFDFSTVDKYVRTVRLTHRDSSVELFAKSVARPYKSDMDKARALFKWISENVKYDPMAFSMPAIVRPIQNNNNNNGNIGESSIMFLKSGTSGAGGDSVEISPPYVPTSRSNVLEEIDTTQRYSLCVGDDERAEDVLRSQKSGRSGFALLFDKMAKSIGLKTTIVYGYLRSPADTPYDGNFIPDANHAWNVVLVGPEYRFIDCGAASLSHPALSACQAHLRIGAGALMSGGANASSSTAAVSGYGSPAMSVSNSSMASFVSTNGVGRPRTPENRSSGIFTGLPSLAGARNRTASNSSLTSPVQSIGGILKPRNRSNSGDVSSMISIIPTLSNQYSQQQQQQRQSRNDRRQSGGRGSSTPPPAFGNGSSANLYSSSALDSFTGAALSADDHYFLTDPKELVYTHFAAEPQHQFLHPIVPASVYWSLPFVCSPYFIHRVRIRSQESRGGVMEINGTKDHSLVLELGKSPVETDGDNWSMDVPDIGVYAEVEVIGTAKPRNNNGNNITNFPSLGSTCQSSFALSGGGNESFASFAYPAGHGEGGATGIPGYYSNNNSGTRIIARRKPLVRGAIHKGRRFATITIAGSDTMHGILRVYIGERAKNPSQSPINATTYPFAFSMRIVPRPPAPTTGFGLGLDTSAPNSMNGSLSAGSQNISNSYNGSYGARFAAAHAATTGVGYGTYVQHHNDWVTMHAAPLEFYINEPVRGTLRVGHPYRFSVHKVGESEHRHTKLMVRAPSQHVAKFTFQPHDQCHVLEKYAPTELGTLEIVYDVGRSKNYMVIASYRVTK